MFLKLGRSQKLFEEQGEHGGAGGNTASLSSINAEDVAKIVNQAVTSQLSRMLPKAIEGVLPTLTKTVSEQVAATAKPPEPVQKPDESRPSPELLALQRQIADLQTANKASEERAQLVERKAREDAAYGELRTELARHIKTDFVDIVAKSLYYADKRVEFDDAGKPLFKAMIPSYQGGPMQETLLPLRDGVEAFARSKEADVYRPAPTTKTPHSPPPRIPTSASNATPVAGGKIPTTLEDPGFASRLAAELSAQGIPTGAIE